MAVHIAKRPIEVAGQIINGAHTDFPRIEDAIADLRRDGQAEIIARHTEAEIAAINDLSLQIGHIREKLRWGLARKAEKHQKKGCNDC